MSESKSLGIYIKSTLLSVVPIVAVAVAIASVGLSGQGAMAQTKKTRYSSQADWNLKAKNLQPHGVNPYYQPLIPGHKYVMDEPHFDDDGDRGHYRKEVVVLDEVENFDVPSIGGKFQCAVVEEKEFLDGDLFSRSLNWYCIDKTNNTIYTMGEMAWETRDDRGDMADTVTESWRVGEPDSYGLIEAGLIMPGVFLRGARWIIDGAEGQTLVGGEAAETGITMATPAGTFENCVRIREYDLMDPEDVTDKVWAYGIGLVFDTSDGKLLESDSLPKRKGQKITDEMAQAIALKKVPGVVTHIGIERKLGGQRIVVEVLADEGPETDVIIDMETGKILGTET